MAKLFTTSHGVEIVAVILVLGLLSMRGAECTYGKVLEYSAINCRKHSAVLTEFGGVGDGITSNTAAFKNAIDKLSTLAPDGGAQLIVPPGKWLTGPFNLTSHFTLYIDKEAVILATQNEAEWPIIEPLPSYGRGREADGGRYGSFIFGTNLTDVVITGGNGTIHGQGESWWKKFRGKELNITRPHLIELLYSNQIQISNLTLINSPFWNVHPVYSRDVLIQGLTILAPIDSPNTDGIDPDSCSNVKIEDCYVVSGDDCIAVKSGWDQYGIKFGMPTEHVIIRRFTCISPDSATIALGSEMSGGIQDVRAEDITAINAQSGVRIKSAIGRGGYVKDIFVKGMKIDTMKYVFWMNGNYGSHPDGKFDPNALPIIQNINYRDMVAHNVTIAGSLAGIEGDPYTGICISNVTIDVFNINGEAGKLQWNCTNIEGITNRVTPIPCNLLPEKEAGKIFDCAYPIDKLAIDNIQLKTCSGGGI